MTGTEWCKLVDAVMLNPNASRATLDIWFNVGHKQNCYSTSMLHAPELRQIEKPQDPCIKAFQVLGNPNIDPFFKQAVLEKMRNRGCLN